MKKAISWNNNRRCLEYWISISCLLFCGLNVTGFFSLNGHPLARSLRGNLYKWYSLLIPSFTNNRHGVEYYLFTLITLYLIEILIIWLLNQLLGVFPNLQVSENENRHAYLLKTVVLGDIVIGIFLELYAIRGMFELCTVFKSTSVATWMYIAVMLYGSFLYCKSTLLIKKISMANKIIRYEKDFEKCIWYCVSNCKERASTFSRVPWKGRIRYILVDERDLKNLDNISEDSFLYYLFLINTHENLTESFRNDIDRVIKMPHANIVTLLLGESDDYKELINNLLKQKNVHLYKYPACNHCEHLDIEKFIEEVGYHNNKIKLQPFRFLSHEFLRNIYSNVVDGPEICLDFLKIIMNDLDIMPAIYALFDYVDLQYRIQIAFTLVPDSESQFKWMHDNERNIGNVNNMSTILEKSGVFERNNEYLEPFSTREFYEKIITIEDKRLIYKYLPHYYMDYNRSILDAIIFMTSSLRNVLRGHGTFEKNDSMSLYTLVFKLALLNLYILNGNTVKLSTDGTIIWKGTEHCYYRVLGKTTQNSIKVLSPFLIAEKSGNILVFNNWNSGTIEYINYLDGTLILPKYTSVKLQ